MAKPKYSPHPLVDKLISGTGEAGAVKLLGYFGNASDGVVKVYPSLDDLCVYYQIREGDIVHVEDAAAEELPHGGSAIWVKANAPVERCVNQRTSIEARFLAGEISGYMTKGPAATYRSLAARQAPAGGSVWPCSVIYGYCLASNFPCAHTEQYWCPGEVDPGPTYAGYTCVRECYSVRCPPTARWCPTDETWCKIISAFCLR
jgi:hypothetical protein